MRCDEKKLLPVQSSILHGARTLKMPRQGTCKRSTGFARNAKEERVAIEQLNRRSQPVQIDWAEEALWEGVLLPALLPACSLRSVFFSGRWPGPVGSFRSTAPHHNPPFLELATTSSPCQAMKLCESASNVELPLKPKSCWFQTELDDLDT